MQKVVVEFESKGGVAVTDWLERLNPNREYMTPAANENRPDEPSSDLFALVFSCFA